ETGRAMVQIEMENLSKQIAENENLQKKLGLIDLTAKPEKAAFGSLVTTENLYFFISIGLGLLQYQQQSVLCISAQSPVAMSIIGKGLGDSFIFLNQKQLITNIV